MQDNDLSQEQKDYLDMVKEQGMAFKGMVSSDGWKGIKSYYEAQVKDFATQILTGDRDVIEFEKTRWQLQGMRKLIAYVDSCIKEFEGEGIKRFTE